MDYAIFLPDLFNLNCMGYKKFTEPMPQDLILKFAIADDHKIFRDGIKMALNGKHYITCCKQFQIGKTILSYRIYVSI